jgi:hypothetical protein
LQDTRIKIAIWQMFEDKFKSLPKRPEVEAVSKIINSGVMFKTLHFLRNLQMGPIN